MSGASSRRKGFQFERDVANALKEVFPNAKRHLEYQFSEAAGYDLDGTEPFKIQCKRNKKYCSVTKIEEVKEEGVPVLITKGDGKKPIVCMYFEDWVKLIKKS